MRIVVDLQAIQSPANGTRGIGRYSASLIEAMLRQGGAHEWVFALNAALSPSIDPIRERMEHLAGRDAFRIWHPPAAAHSAPARRAGQRLYEAFLHSLQPDVVHVSSLFEGHYDPCVTSVGTFVRQPTSTTLYDLIPLLHPKIYLTSTDARAWYMQKIEALKRADAWLAISESSRREGIEHLGLDPDRCVNVSTAADEHFVALHLSTQQAFPLRARYGLDKPFVMYTGGIDHRKNIEGLIRAFALLPQTLREQHQLAVVCSVREEDRIRLVALAAAQGLAPGQLVLTGFVPDDDLVALYNLCELFVFPSRHEGFGLPALEAMRCGAAVIASNTSSLPEVVGRADAMFDPYDDNAIAQKITQVLGEPSFLADLRQHGLARSRRFSWDECARRALDALEMLHERGPRSSSVARRPMRRPRLAYVSPLPPERSGIAGYSADLLPALAQYYEIHLISELDETLDPTLAAAFPIRSIDWFRRNSGCFDRVVYQFGDSTFHTHMFELLSLVPGVVVLHDFFLSNIHGYRETVDGEQHAWSRALYRSHGYPALIDRFEMAGVDLGKKYPVNLAVAEDALGVIVHSEYSRQLARRWYGNAIARDWSVVPLTRTTHIASPRERLEARKALGIPVDQFVACSFGLLGPAKLNHRLLESWRLSGLDLDDKSSLYLVGENDPGQYGASLLQNIADGSSNIQITGWTEDEVYSAYLAAADVAVQLRAHSRGESSAAVLDAMNHGVTVIANANGALSSLPGDAARLLPDEFSDEQLAQALRWAHDQPDARRQFGRRARQVIAAYHSPPACAELYRQVIESAHARGEFGRPGLVQASGFLDPPPPGANRDVELAAIAEALTRSLPSIRYQRQVLVDVSGLDSELADQAEGVKGTLAKALRQEIRATRIEPIRIDPDRGRYVHARAFSLALLGLDPGILSDDPVEPRRGDTLVILGGIAKSCAAPVLELRDGGVALVPVAPQDLGPLLAAQASS